MHCACGVCTHEPSSNPGPVTRDLPLRPWVGDGPSIGPTAGDPSATIHTAPFHLRLLPGRDPLAGDLPCRRRVLLRRLRRRRPMHLLLRRGALPARRRWKPHCGQGGAPVAPRAGAWRHDVRSGEHSRSRDARSTRPRRRGRCPSPGGGPAGHRSGGRMARSRLSGVSESMRWVPMLRRGDRGYGATAE